MRLIHSPGAKTYSWRRRKLRLAATYFRGNPVWCAWQVTYRCNFRCAFCGYWKEGARAAEELTAAQELTSDEFAVGGEKLARLGTLLISLAGGEPLLRDDLAEIIRALARHHLPMMTTNGYGLTPARARELWSAGLVGASVSLDYADEDKHDRRRGRAGAFAGAVDALRILAAERTNDYQRVNLMSVLMDDNLDQMAPLVELAGRLGVNFMVQPYSTLKTGDTRFSPPPGAARALVRLKRAYPQFLSNVRFLERFDEVGAGTLPACLAGRAFFNIDERGDVAACVEKRDAPVGNLVRDPIRGVLRALGRAGGANTCRACWYNCRGEVESLYTMRGALGALPILLADSFGNRARGESAACVDHAGAVG